MRYFSLLVVLSIIVLIHFEAISHPIGLPRTFGDHTTTPIDRLIKNQQSYIAKNPDVSEGYYLLGRIHYLPFHNRVPFVSNINRGLESTPRGSKADEVIHGARMSRARQEVMDDWDVKAEAEIIDEKWEKYKSLVYERTAKLQV